MCPSGLSFSSLFENYQIVDNHESTQNPHMSMIRVTGCQFAAARALACLSRQELADRAGLSYHSIRAWERSSNSIPEATYGHLLRAFEALEATGVRFSDDGVYRERPAPLAATVIHSEGAMSAERKKTLQAI